MKLGSGMNQPSFMSQTGDPTNNFVLPPQTNMPGSRESGLRGYDGLGPKSNSVNLENQMNFKRPSTGALDFSKGNILNNITEQDSN